MLVVNTNITAMRAQNVMRSASAAVQRSMERLSTGQRINRASDDPAGLAIASGMSSQIAGSAQAIRNAADAMGYAQTADGVLGNVASMVQRVRELALQSASGTYGDADRRHMDAEVGQLTGQMVQMLRDAKFNGITLFDTSPAGGGVGTAGTPGYGSLLNVQSGANRGDSFELAIDNMDVSWLAGVSVGTVSGAEDAIDSMGSFLERISTTRAGLGATMSGLDATMSVLNTGITAMTEARSRIMDTDFAAESAELARAQIILQASTAMLSQANQMQKSLVRMLIE